MPDVVVGAIVVGEVVRAYRDRVPPFYFCRVTGATRDIFVPQARVRGSGALALGDRVEFEIRDDHEGRIFGHDVRVIGHEDDWSNR